MTRQLLSAISLVVFAALAVAPASAQGDVTTKVDIPFSFIVKGKSLPAGEYTVSELSPTILKISGSEDATLAMVRSESRGSVEKGKLVFHRYGSSYFLSRVEMRTGSRRYQLPTSSAEKKLRRATPDQESLAILTRDER
jgi:hypothetical protein